MSGLSARDTVLDIFDGSNTTGSAAEKLDRRWMAFEKERTCLATSVLNNRCTRKRSSSWTSLGSPLRQ